LHGDIASGKVTLDLRDAGAAVVLDKLKRCYEQQGPLTSRSFLLTWKGHVQEGIVTEVNLQVSTEVYGTPLDAQAILVGLCECLNESCHAVVTMDEQLQMMFGLSLHELFPARLECLKQLKRIKLQLV
jgi:hypothetical protein